MPALIDHIVIVSNDLESAIVNAEQVGFTVVRGGVHGSGNTQNALISFADVAYLELFSPTEHGRIASHRWFPRVRNGGGLVDFCLLCSNVAAEVAAIRRRGIEFSTPFPMSRVRPDGTRVDWLLSVAPGATGETGLPFLIEDLTPRKLRVPHAAEQLWHKNGVVGVLSLTVLVRDLEESMTAYGAVFGRALSRPIESVGRASIKVGPCSIELVVPSTSEEQTHLAKFGQGPFQMSLAARGGVAEAGTTKTFDPDLFSGAKISIVGVLGTSAA